MSDTQGAAAPTTEQAATSAPAESEQATPAASVPSDAAPATTETTELETAKPEGGEEGSEERRKLTRNQRLQRKAARLATMVAEQAAQIEQLKQRSATPDADLPKPSDYPQGEYDPSYVADLAAHKAAKKISAKLDEQKIQSVQERMFERTNEAVEDFLERVEEIKPTLPEFDKVMDTFESRGGKFAPHVIEEIRDSEKGPQLAYQLAQNPGLTAQLNAMSPRDAAREIGRLEAKVSLPQPKKQTQAPAPMTTLKGGASPSKDPFELAKSDDISEYVKFERARKKASA